MTGAFAWLNDFAQWFARWIPRLTLVQPTHRGVLFGPSGSTREVGPGLVLFWPLTHALQLVPVTTQSVQLCAQLLPAHGGTAVGWLPNVLVCAVAVQFRVASPVRAATEALNLHALVDNRVAAAVAKHRAADHDAWLVAATDYASTELAHFGVAIERLDFTQLGTGVALKNVADWSNNDNPAGTRPE